MTKFKYENQGGRGYRTFHPFSDVNTKTSKEKEKQPTKLDLLLKDIKNNRQLKFGLWSIDDLSYKKINMGQAVKILYCVVKSSSDIYPILREMRSNKKLYGKVKKLTKSNYSHISSKAVKITIEQNIDILINNGA